MERATIFNIERFATEDGPGIRTAVFLKGCGLRCKWCANPESQSLLPEILVKNTVCIRCGKCAEVCPQKAISFREPYGYITDAKRCNLCMACVDHCYLDARQRMGTEYTAEELLEVLLRDREYYTMSGGGITFTGGEPFLHSGFLREICWRLRAEGITTLAETCGYVPLETIQEAQDALDYIFYDIKQMDCDKHQALTGHGNAGILENLRWLCEHFKGELTVRYPYIPGCNDSETDLRAFLSFAAGLPGIHGVVFLPYHRLGLPKYNGLGRDYPMGDLVSLKKSQLAHVLSMAEEYHIHAGIG